MTRGRKYVRAADGELGEAYEPPMPLADYVDRALETPSIASHASKYLLEAIEAAGTRTVVERGEEVERYRFFDDPANDGEHAVLGNTTILNGFVDDLRSIAAGRGKAESIIWFSGPTATGKSELKRCLVNGLREYSKTPAGRRYTLEWNAERPVDTRGLSYGETTDQDERWLESPVQAHPLSVFPPSVLADLLADLDARSDDGIGVRVPDRLDPFSREARSRLEERYRRRGDDDLFSHVTDPDHLRVKNYVVDVGTGIGVLHAEDTGSPRERLVGSWMPELLREMDSRGRKNPQAFSYDGVLSQGNGGVTIIEDASQHADLLRKLLNVPEEGAVKLDRGMGMPVDTQLVVISNPDLEAQLNQHADRRGHDPLKALKRRLDKREFRYLTSRSLEVELIHRELGGDREVWTVQDPDAVDQRVSEPLVASVRDPGNGRVEREFAPHTVEAAAMFDVVSRLDASDLPGDLTLVDKALLFDRGYLVVGDDRVPAEEFSFDGDARDGEHGIPVTYTRDVLAGLLTGDTDRAHPELAVERVVTPRDALDAMTAGLGDAPVFADAERDEIADRVVPVRDYILARQEDDVLDAMLAEHRVDEAAVAGYVAHVYAWAIGEPVDVDGEGTVTGDPLTMKVFEIEHLGRFDEGDYDGTTPHDEVESFRRDHVISAVNRHAWEHRTEDFRVDAVDLTAIPVIADVLAASDWDDVRRSFGALDPRQWADPPTGTETERVKRETLDRLTDRGYTPASAELTSRRVMAEVSDRWD